jgi:hypothetical protein
MPLSAARREPRRVLANSVPKAGTHLLQRCLLALPGLVDGSTHVDISQAHEEIRGRLAALPPGGVATGHLIHEAPYVDLVQASGVAHLLIVRDPRDVVVSYAEYAARAEHHYLHAYFRALEPAARLMAVIEGVPGDVPWDQVALRDIGAAFRQFTSWRAQPGLLLVRFEDLVGAAGGGDARVQAGTITAIAAHVGLGALDDQTLSNVAQATFDPGSPTFRRGGIGEWRERFSPAHVAALHEVAADVLIDLGYQP